MKIVAFHPDSDDFDELLICVLNAGWYADDILNALNSSPRFEPLRFKAEPIDYELKRRPDDATDSNSENQNEREIQETVLQK